MVAGTGRGHNDRVHACSLLLALEAIPIELRLRRIGARPTHGAATQKYERRQTGKGEKRFHGTPLVRLCGIASLKPTLELSGRCREEFYEGVERLGAL